LETGFHPGSGSGQAFSDHALVNGVTSAALDLRFWVQEELRGGDDLAGGEVAQHL
jgi:hypothetical protein